MGDISRGLNTDRASEDISGYIQIKIYFYMLIIRCKFKCHSHHYTVYSSLLYCNILCDIKHSKKIHWRYASQFNDCSNESLQNIEQLPSRQIAIDVISEKVIFLLIQATVIL